MARGVEPEGAAPLPTVLVATATAEGSPCGTVTDSPQGASAQADVWCMCDTTDPEHPRLAVRGRAVSGENGNLVVEPMPSVWTFKAPRQRQHTTLAHASRRRHLRPDPTGGNRQSPLPVLLYIFYFPILFLTTFLSPSPFLVFLFFLAARVNLVWLTTLCYAICGYSHGVSLA